MNASTSVSVRSSSGKTKKSKGKGQSVDLEVGILKNGFHSWLIAVFCTIGYFIVKYVPMVFMNLPLFLAWSGTCRLENFSDCSIGFREGGLISDLSTCICSATRYPLSTFENSFPSHCCRLYLETTTPSETCWRRFFSFLTVNILNTIYR